MKSMPQHFEYHHNRKGAAKGFIVKLSDGTTDYYFADIDMQIGTDHVYPLLDKSSSNCKFKEEIDPLKKNWSVSSVTVKLTNAAYRKDGSGNWIKLIDDLSDIADQDATIYLYAGSQVDNLDDCLIGFVGVVYGVPGYDEKTITVKIIDKGSTVGTVLPSTLIGDIYSDAPRTQKIRTIPIAWGKFVFYGTDGQLFLREGSGLARGEAISGAFPPKCVFGDHVSNQISAIFFKETGLINPVRCYSPTLNASDSSRTTGQGGVFTGFGAAGIAYIHANGIDDENCQTGVFASPSYYWRIYDQILGICSMYDSYDTGAGAVCYSYGTWSMNGSAFIRSLEDENRIKTFGIQYYVDDITGEASPIIKVALIDIDRDVVLECFQHSISPSWAWYDTLVSASDALLPVWHTFIMQGDGATTGSWTGSSGSRYLNIDDPIDAPDGDSSRVYTTDDGTPYICFGRTTTYDIPDASTVRLVVRCKGVGSPNFQMFIRYNSTNYYSTSMTAGSDYADFVFDWSVPPFGGTDWHNMTDLDFGVYVTTSPLSSFSLTQLYVGILPNGQGLQNTNIPSGICLYSADANGGDGTNNNYNMLNVGSIRYKLFYKYKEFNQPLAQLEGREYPSWITDRSSNYADGYTIIDPAGIVEDIHRTYLGLASTDLDEESFINAENTAVQMYLNLHHENRIHTKDLIKEICEQSTFCYIYSAAGKAKLIPLNEEPASVARTISYVTIIPGSVKVYQTEFVVNNLNLESHQVQEYDDVLWDNDNHNNSTSQASYGERTYDAKWPNLYLGYADHVARHLVKSADGTNANADGIWANKHTVVEFSTADFVNADLEVGDWIGFNTDCDPHFKNYGASWSGAKLLIFSFSQYRNMSKIKAMKLF